MSEKLLVASAQSGDTKAFDKLVQSCIPKLKNLLCKNYQLQLTDFDDIIQIASNKAWTKISQFRNDCAFLTWFYTILRNETLNFIKKRKTLDKREIPAAFFNDDEVDIDYDHVLPSSLDQKLEDNAQSLLERKETLATYREIIEDILHKLTPIHREIIQLVLQEEMSYKDISNKLDIPIGTVMSRLFFARQHAQKLIKQYAHKNEVELECLK